MYTLRIRDNCCDSTYTFSNWEAALEVARMISDKKGNLEIAEPNDEDTKYYAAWNDDIVFDLELYESKLINSVEQWKKCHGEAWDINS